MIIPTQVQIVKRKFQIFCCLMLCSFALWAKPNAAGFYTAKLANGKLIKLYLQEHENHFMGRFGFDDVAETTYIPNAETVWGKVEVGNFLVLKHKEHGVETNIFEGFVDESSHLLRGDWLYPHSEVIDLKRQTMLLSDTVHIKMLEQKEYNQKLHETTQIHMPQLFSEQTLPDAAKQLNAYISNRVYKIKSEFLRDVQISDAKDNVYFFGNSELHIDHEVTYAKYPYVSIRFNISTYYAGAAHPLHSTLTINYDLQKNKLLQLEDIFKQYTPYLQYLSELSEEQLLQNLQSVTQEDGQKAMRFWIKNGTHAKAENYQNWNLTPLGILISFDPYQVAPYALGRQELIIPYDIFSGLLAFRLAN